MVKINGKRLEMAGRTLADYLVDAGFDSRWVAVERNGETVPKKLYGETILADRDTLEVVSSVEGG